MQEIAPEVLLDAACSSTARPVAIGAALSVLIPLIGRAGGGGRGALVVAGLPVARVWAVLAADRPARQLGMPTLPEHATHQRTDQHGGQRSDAGQGAD